MNKETKDFVSDGCSGPFSCLGQLGSVFAFVIGGGVLGFAFLVFGLPGWTIFLAPFVALALFWWAMWKFGRIES